MKTTTEKNTGTRMFGCYERELEDYLAGRDTHDLARLAQSMLSDAQEEMASGCPDAARQVINRAKFALDKIARANR